jgi:hypothetical protein
VEGEAAGLLEAHPAEGFHACFQFHIAPVAELENDVDPKPVNLTAASMTTFVHCRSL